MKTASWIIVDRKTGKAVLETFNKKTADAVNTKRYEVLPVLQWLQRINGKTIMKNPTKRKPRTPAQRAATSRMVAANKSRRGKVTAAQIRAAHGGSAKSRKARIIQKRVAGSLSYRVICNGEVIAFFGMKEMAMMYARALHNARPSATISVEG